MKTVRMLVSMAGPNESWKPRDTREVEDHIAEEWQREGIAVVMPDESAVVEVEGVDEQPKRRGRKPRA